ncbi:hypothetical protein CU098_009871 [Rhizopus stolonifer]|uniref:Glutamine synthetase n=1 Tax=Rhizopus stolonifer TaxID=4846 RepID=A0A367K4Z2_RHIST|nr:hypothetical protein CU098_009871 [Rhizopus stolonifer]
MTELTYENIEEELVNDDKVKVAMVDLDGGLRGKLMNKERFLSIVKSGCGFCTALLGWDMQDQLYSLPNGYSGGDNSYHDMLAKIDLTTYRRIPWEEDVPMFLVNFFDPVTRKPVAGCPRNVLKGAVEEYEEMNLMPYCGVEFEFYCFKENIESLTEKGHANLKSLTVGTSGFSILRPLENQEFYYHMFDWLKKFKIDLEGWHAECGPGIFEASILYKEAKESGDRCTLFKTATKQIAKKHNVMASFMAKPYQQYPGASGHIHISVKNKQGENIFSVGEPSHIPNMTKSMVWFLAGLLRGLPSILPMLAPTINSYKRLVENFWAPTTVSWGMGTRHCAVRVLVPPYASPESAQMELRVPGADINPQLALAAVIRCGMWGIKTQQELPYGPTQTAKDAAERPRLAYTLQEATAIMDEKDSIARKVLGDEFVDHYVISRKHEWNVWQNAVTDFELKRYMEYV